MSSECVWSAGNHEVGYSIYRELKSRGKGRVGHRYILHETTYANGANRVRRVRISSAKHGEIVNARPDIALGLCWDVISETPVNASRCR